jgi:hypothetical protein
MSHFSFTRASYDKCAIEKKDQESAGPFNWVTDKVYESPNVCFQSASPFMQNPFRSVPENKIDIESDLRGHKFQVSKCPTHKFDPTRAEKIDTQINECKDNGLVPEYTRLNKSCNIFSGMTINRFHPLCEDLQQLNKIHSNSYIGTNTRLQIKDAFKQEKSKREPLEFQKDLKTPCTVQGKPCVYLKYDE